MLKMLVSAGIGRIAGIALDATSMWFTLLSINKAVLIVIVTSNLAYANYTLFNKFVVKSQKKNNFLHFLTNEPVERAKGEGEMAQVYPPYIQSCQSNLAIFT